MIEGKSILAVVPARGGSKGIKLKNLREIGGKSLIRMVAEVISQVGEIDKAVVSTDHEGIAIEAERFGLEAPFRRPNRLSGDRIGDVDVLTHALLESERIYERRFDIVLMLQPTSPMRRPEHVRSCLDKFCSDNVDATWTVSETDSKAHPLKQLVLGEGGLLDLYDAKGHSIIARQQLNKLYHRNGVAYAISRTCLVSKESISGHRSNAVVINDPLANIDEEIDLEWAEFLLRRQGYIF